MSHFGSAGPPDIRDTHSLLVLNITFRTSADDLYPLFDRYGKVVDIFIPRDRRTGESRGFAFVRYKYAEEAQKAIERLDGRNVDGRDMVVQYAKYGRDMETIHRGKITQASPSKWSSRSRSRSPRRGSRPRSPVRGGKKNFGPPSNSYPSPPRGRDRYAGGPPAPSGRHRNEYRERDRDYRHRSRSRERYERSDRYREREKDHRRRSPSRSASRSRSRSRGRADYDGRSANKVVEREASPPVRRNTSASPKQSSLSPGHQRVSPARKSPSPVARESLSPVRSVSPAPRRSISPVQRSASRSPSPRRHTASLTPEPQSPFQD